MNPTEKIEALCGALREFRKHNPSTDGCVFRISMDVYDHICRQCVPDPSAPGWQPVRLAGLPIEIDKDACSLLYNGDVVFTEQR